MKCSSFLLLVTLLNFMVNSCQNSEHANNSFPKPPYSTLEHLNDMTIIVEQSPTFNKFLNNDRISFDYKAIVNKNNSKEYFATNELDFTLTDSLLQIRKTYFHKGKSLSFLPTYIISDTSISVALPTIVNINPFEYYTNPDYKYSQRIPDLAGVIELRVNLKVDSTALIKSLYFNGGRIK